MTGLKQDFRKYRRCSAKYRRFQHLLRQRCSCEGNFYQSVVAAVFVGVINKIAYEPRHEGFCRQGQNAWLDIGFHGLSGCQQYGKVLADKLHQIAEVGLFQSDRMIGLVQPGKNSSCVSRSVALSACLSMTWRDSLNSSGVWAYFSAYSQ